MTPHDLPDKGSAGAELQRQAHQYWREAAARAGLDLTGFDPAASLQQRLLWATSMALTIAASYARYSTEMQDSTLDQIRADMEHAAKLRLYVPPEFLCIDEAASGRKARREGLERLKLIFGNKLARVLVVFKLSRLFRQAHKGFALVQELVEDGVRVTSATQGFDTDDKKAWKLAMMIHGIFDETLIEANACIDLRPQPYSQRLKTLLTIVSSDGPVPLRSVETAITTKAKRQLFTRLKEQHREGIVFKRHIAPFTPGRPNSGGDQLKLKFTATTSCIVAEANGSKRSVKLELIDGDRRVPVGNVTIPPSQPIPLKGSVIEARYLYAYPGGALFQPVYLGPRDDIGHDACTVRQLKFKPADSDEGEA